MTGYILRRLIQLIPVLFLASIGIWAMVYAVPGSPIGQQQVREPPRRGRGGAGLRMAAGGGATSTTGAACGGGACGRMTGALGIGRATGA